MAGSVVLPFGSEARNTRMASRHMLGVKPGESKPLRRFHPSAFNLGMQQNETCTHGTSPPGDGGGYGNSSRHQYFPK
jgi:hypothetical protein